MTEYFIDPVYGSDSNAGTSEDSPWRTFDNVNSGSFSGGDKIRLKAGTTFRDELIVPSDGSSGAPLLIDSYDTGDDPLVSGSIRARNFSLGSNLISNPSFENWTSTVLDDWTSVTPGSTDVTEETSDVILGDSAVSLDCDSAGNLPYIYCEEMSLDDDTKYRLSLWHKDPDAEEGDETYLAVIIWRTDSVGSLTGQYWDPYNEQWEGNGGLNGYAIDSRAWWSSFHLDFDTGPNASGYNYYYVRIQPYNVSPYNNYENKSFLVDGCYCGKVTTEGTAEIADGGFEAWTSSVLDEWTETVGESGSDVSENTTDPNTGDSAVDMYVDDAGNGATSVRIDQTLQNTLSDNATYYVSLYQKIDLVPVTNDARLAILIWRSGGGPTDEYLYSDGTWQEKDYSGYPLDQASTTWTQATMSFDTGANANGHTTYHVGIQPYQPGNGAAKFSTVGRTFTFDDLTLSGVGESPDNLLENWSFEDWTGSAPNNWTLVNDGETTLSQHTEARHGSKGVYLTIDDDDSDVGLKQTGISLDASTAYRFGVFTHAHEISTANSIELAIQIKRESDSYYWDGSAWTSTESDAVTGHYAEWDLLASELTTGGSDDTYTFFIHRAAGTKDKAKEELYFDLAFIAAKNASNEQWAMYFPRTPRHVWVSGTIDGTYVNHHRLHDETETSLQTGSHHPHLWGYSYDRVNELLYINVGEDPGLFFIEGSMRDTCIDFNGKDYITCKNIQCYRAVKHGISLGYAATGTRPAGVTAEGNTVKYIGQTGIMAGYQPDAPYEGGIHVSEDHQTPSNITIQENDVFRYSENGKNAIPVAENYTSGSTTYTTEMLTDPSLEEWTSSDDLTYWEETAGGSGTVEREVDDVFCGESCCVITTDSNGDSPLVHQEYLTGIFEDSSYDQATVSLWYKTPDWDGNATHGLFALYVIRYDSSGAAQGQVLDSNGVFQTGYAYGIIPLPQSLTWTKYSLTFDRPADYEDYPIYEFGVHVYTPGKANTTNERIFFDRASFSNGVTEWYQAKSYRAPDCGIQVAGGDSLEGGSGSVLVSANKVDGAQGKINYSMGRNGINIRNGGDWKTSPKSWAIVEKNEVTRASHAISVLANYGDTGAYVGLAKIQHNYVHDTGDDGIWIEGFYIPQSKIAYNVIVDTGDNGIDCMNSAHVEIYNNTISGGVNESIAIWGLANGFTARAFVYNNVIRNWGADWVDGNPGKRRGSAIGISLYGDVGESLIDYNMYYSEDDTTASEHPFHLTDLTDSSYTQLSFSDWQAYFDANGVVDDPELLDPANDDMRITKASPCFEAALDLSTLDVTMGGLTNFDKDGVIDDALSYRSTFPTDVQLSAQDTLWDLGAYDEPTATIVDEDADFPADKSLIGVTAYVVDETNHRIWKGIITSNTSTELYLDEWESVFNADGEYPGGTLSYYVGYIYLYDKTPAYAFINDHWEKNLTEYQMLTNRLTTANTIFFKKNLNHGAIQDTDSASMLTDRTSVRIFDGKHRNFQLEHALVTNQAIRIKEITYHGVWTRGKYDQ